MSIKSVAPLVLIICSILLYYRLAVVKNTRIFVQPPTSIGSPSQPQPTEGHIVTEGRKLVPEANDNKERKVLRKRKRKDSFDILDYIEYPDDESNQFMAGGNSSTHCDLGILGNTLTQRANWRLKTKFDAEHFCSQFPKKGVVRGDPPNQYHPPSWSVAPIHNWTSPQSHSDSQGRPLPLQESEPEFFLPLRARDTPAKLYYGMMFGIEFDMLEVALHEIFPVVDVIGIIESKRSHSLKSKEQQLWKAMNSGGPYYDRFRRFFERPDGSPYNKIFSYSFIPRRRYTTGWDIEKRQRQVFMQAVRDHGAKDGDIVIANMDLDEVLSATTLLKMKYCEPDDSNTRKPSFNMAHFRYHFGCLNELSVSRMLSTAFVWGKETSSSFLYDLRKEAQRIDLGAFTVAVNEEYNRRHSDLGKQFVLFSRIDTTDASRYMDAINDVAKRDDPVSIPNVSADHTNIYNSSSNISETTLDFAHSPINEALNKDLNALQGSFAWHMSTFGLDVLKFKNANSPHKFARAHSTDEMLLHAIDNCLFSEVYRPKVMLWEENAPLLLRSACQWL